MKIQNTVCISILFLIVFITANAFSDSLSERAVSEQNTAPNIYEMDDNVESRLASITSEVEQIEYLRSVINGSQEELENLNHRKSSAIRLLGKCGGTNAIPILIKNLEFEDSQRHDYPSVIALAGMGEVAVSPLLEVIKNDGDKIQLYFSVKTLMRIKGTGYNEFAKQQIALMPSNSWKNLFQYAIED